MAAILLRCSRQHGQCRRRCKSGFDSGNRRKGAEPHMQAPICLARSLALWDKCGYVLCYTIGKCDVIGSNSAEGPAKRIFDVKSGRLDTAAVVSVACGLASFSIAVVIFALQYNFSKYFGIKFPDIDNNSHNYIVTISFVLIATALAPFLESLILAFIHHVLTGLLKLNYVTFIFVNTVSFAILHKHPINAASTFLIFSTQYIFMRSHYGKRTAFWSIVTSHGVHNALAIAITFQFGDA